MAQQGGMMSFVLRGETVKQEPSQFFYGHGLFFLDISTLLATAFLVYILDPGESLSCTSCPMISRRTWRIARYDRVCSPWCLSHDHNTLIRHLALKGTNMGPVLVVKIWRLIVYESKKKLQKFMVSLEILHQMLLLRCVIKDFKVDATLETTPVRTA